MGHWGAKYQASLILIPTCCLYSSSDIQLRLSLGTVPELRTGHPESLRGVLVMLLPAIDIPPRGISSVVAEHDGAPIESCGVWISTLAPPQCVDNAFLHAVFVVSRACAGILIAEYKPWYPLSKGNAHATGYAKRCV